MEQHIYYLTQRPAGPGTLPIKGMVSITTQYEKRTYIHAIKAGAWARVEYARKLDDKEVSDYELTYSPRESTKEVQTNTTTSDERKDTTMTKAEIVTAIMEKTDAFKKTHLMAKAKDELAVILESLTAHDSAPADAPADAPVATQDSAETSAQPKAEAEATEISDDEKKMLALIPAESAKTEMVARPLIIKYKDAQKISVDAARKIFRLLRKHGLLTSKGKAEGVSRTTFQLTAEGIQAHAESLAG